MKIRRTFSGTTIAVFVATVLVGTSALGASAEPHTGFGGASAEVSSSSANESANSYWKPPVNLERPVIQGETTAGNMLTVTRGVWDSSGLIFTYQWKSNSVPIAGANSATYSVKAEDEGAILTVAVVARKPWQSEGTYQLSRHVFIQHTTTLALEMRDYFVQRGDVPVMKVTADSHLNVSLEGSLVVSVDGVVVDRTPVGGVVDNKWDLELCWFTPGHNAVVVTFEPSDIRFAPSTSYPVSVWVWDFTSLG